MSEAKGRASDSHRGTREISPCEIARSPGTQLEARRAVRAAYKEPEPDDPMALAAASCPGDSDEAMAETIVEEFARMGFSDGEILALFRQPFYAATHRILRERGEGFVTGAIVRVRSRLGYWRCSDE